MLNEKQLVATSWLESKPYVILRQGQRISAQVKKLWGCEILRDTWLSLLNRAGGHNFPQLP